MLHLHRVLLSLISFLFMHHSNAYEISARPLAAIRVGSALSHEEQQWLATREPIIKNSLEQLLGMSLTDDEIPRIAFCCSGGGYRAMVATIGMLQGMCTPPQSRSVLSNALHYVASWLYHSPTPAPLHLPTQTAVFAGSSIPTLFDTVSYCATLSGSTWALSSWLYSGMHIDAYCARLARNIEKSIWENIDFTELSKTLADKHNNQQPLSLVDIYGSLLAQKLLKGFGDNPYAARLTEQQAYASSGKLPFMVYTSIIGESAPDYQWVEYTPYEIGSSYLNAWISTNAFNRTFNGGASTNIRPEQPLSFFLGIWGSAMCMTAQEFIQFIKPHVHQEIIDLETDEQEFVHTLEADVASLLSHSKIIGTTQRLSPARVYNWTYQCPDLPMHDHRTITLVDAGIDFRIPTPPLLRKERAIDIIIIMDASDRPLSTELHLAQAYAQQHQLPFPKINYQHTTQPFSVHGIGNSLGAPIIIYMPLVKNPAYHNGWDPRTAGFTSTYNFKYKQEQTYLLAGLTRSTFIEHQQDILNIIKEWINTQRKSKA